VLRGSVAEELAKAILAHLKARKRPERLEDTLRPAARPTGIEVTMKPVQLDSGPAAYVS
jgi:hypothetical protein